MILTQTGAGALVPGCGRRIGRTIGRSTRPSIGRSLGRRITALAWALVPMATAPAAAMPQNGFTAPPAGRGVTSPAPASATAADTTGLQELVQRALAVNPGIKAALDRAAAARARIGPTGARPDPILMAGVINLPVRSLSFTEDEMTMKMVGVEQILPYRGKLGLRQRIAKLEADEAMVIADSVRLAVVRDVKTAYYEIAYIDAAIAIAERNRGILGDVIRLASARYAAGSGAQQDILRATLDATRLNESANAFREQRLAAVARLNTLLDRPTDTSIGSPVIPFRLARAAVAELPADIRFTSQALGASATGSPLPTLDELEAVALQTSPAIRASRAKASAAAAGLELARKDHLPDIQFSVQYGQRSGSSVMEHGVRSSRSDMVSAVVSLPIPLQRARKQNALVAASRSDLSAIEAERRDAENMVRANVARLHSDIQRSRTQLALYVKAIIPQSRAVVASATSAYTSGTGDFRTVLQAQMTLLEIEYAYHRSLADFAQKVAELEAVAGTDVIR